MPLPNLDAIALIICHIKEERICRLCQSSARRGSESLYPERSSILRYTPQNATFADLRHLI